VRAKIAGRQACNGPTHKRIHAHGVTLLGIHHPRAVALKVAGIDNKASIQTRIPRAYTYTQGVTLIGTLQPRAVALKVAGIGNKAAWGDAVRGMRAKISEAVSMHRQQVRPNYTHIDKSLVCMQREKCVVWWC